jgi:hypothetical protein
MAAEMISFDSFGVDMFNDLFILAHESKAGNNFRSGSCWKCCPLGN